MYIVVWSVEQGVCVPMGFDSGCEGAIEAIGKNDAIAYFPDKPTARKAIDISANNAALRKAQGKPANEDFLAAARKNLRIVECREWKLQK